MKRYGKTLMHHVPEGTTLLLKGLCTNYQPSGETAEKDSMDRNKVSIICYSRQLSYLLLNEDRPWKYSLKCFTILFF